LEPVEAKVVVVLGGNEMVLNWVVLGSAVLEERQMVELTRKGGSSYQEECEDDLHYVNNPITNVLMRDR
jgi:hypothetical protein